jgi:mono/diheme cytochrome c family protein
MTARAPKRPAAGRCRPSPLPVLGLLAALAPAIATAQMSYPKPEERGNPAAIYHNYCSVCHGDRGNGNSRAINSLNPPPRDFTAYELPRDYMIQITARGKPNTAMVGWDAQLSPQEIEIVVDYIRTRFMSLSSNPRLRQGRAIWAEKCMVCHGETGRGNPLHPVGREAKDLATPAARERLTRARMLDVTTNGLSATGMLSFRDSLKKSEIEAVVDYMIAGILLPEVQISGTDAHAGRAGSAPAPARPLADAALGFPDGLQGDVKRGRAFYEANCTPCHGKAGDGQGPRAYFINPRPASFLSEQSRASLSRPAIYTLVSAGKLGTEMPAWRQVATPQEIADVSEYVFQAFVQPRPAQSKR